MGQTVSAVKEAVKGDAEKQKQADDILNATTELGRTQAVNFKLQVINDTVDINVIPIDRVIGYDKVLKCNVSSENTNAILDEITACLSDFDCREVAKGLSNLLSSGLKPMFGNYVEIHLGWKNITSVLSTGEVGGLMRIDLFMFAYRYTSEQLTSITKNVVIISFVVSSAKIIGLRDNVLRTIVQDIYTGSTLDEQKQIFEQLKLARDSQGEPVSESIVKSKLFLAAARAYGGTPV